MEEMMERPYDYTVHLEALIANLRDVYYSEIECPVEAIAEPIGALQSMIRDLTGCNNDSHTENEISEKGTIDEQ
jgi:hypothetical protein